ncbi:putative G-protein coupled receptor 139 [Mustelus asterias]
MGTSKSVDITVIGYPILVIISIPANLMAIVVLSRGRCGLSKGITCYMITMAIADLLVCIFNVTLEGIFRSHFPYSFLMYTSVCSFITFIEVSSVQLSVWSTTLFTLDRFVAISCPKLKLKYCTRKTATVILAAVSVLSFVMNIPVYFRYEPYSVVANVQWGCRTVKGYVSSPAWIAYKWVASLSVPLLPFPLLLLLNSLTVRHILVASRSRRALKAHGPGEASSDPVLKSRTTTIVLLFAVSGSFMILWTPIVMLDLLFDFTEIRSLEGDSWLHLTMRITLLMMYCSTCTNTCIYILTQRRFRAEILNMVKYPVILLFTFLK